MIHAKYFRLVAYNKTKVSAPDRNNYALSLHQKSAAIPWLTHYKAI